MGTADQPERCTCRDWPRCVVPHEHYARINGVPDICAAHEHDALDPVRGTADQPSGDLEHGEMARIAMGFAGVDICNDCGLPYAAEWHAMDALWVALVSHDGRGSLCHVCFTRRAKRVGIKLIWRPFVISEKGVDVGFAPERCSQGHWHLAGRLNRPNYE